MKFRAALLSLFLLTALLVSALPASAQEPQPASPAPNPQPLPFEPASATGQNAPQADAPIGLAALPALKAVLVVGPIDGPTGSETLKEIANMDLAANRLSAYGVQVFKFYTPNDRWADIIAASNGAQFFMYRGHGLNWTSNNWVTPTVGGIEVTEKMYSSDDIKRDIRLAPNAIVMLYGCFTTGSSTTDTAAISFEEARRRTSQYAQPFIEMGAAGYYANWFGDAFAVFVDNLFAGKTLGDSFKQYQDYQGALASQTTHATYTNVPLILSWDNWSPYPIPAPQYNNAFVGQASKTLADLFTPAIQLSATSVGYIARPSARPITIKVNVTSSSSTNISWTAAPAGGGSIPSWVTYTPTTGSTGTTLNITITPTASTGKYTAGLEVKSADGSSKQTLTITMVLTNNPRYVYMPNVIR